MPASHNCLWTVWLVDPGAQELPDSLGGRGCQLAAIGRLDAAPALLNRTAGTIVSPSREEHR